MKLSLVVSTYNSQEVLIDCLRSVKSLASEIIIIDNGSSDDTVKIAKTFTKKIFSHKNNPLMLNQAKNYGFTKAQSKWILNLDPDERLSPTLLNQIKKAIKKENHEAYQFPRKNIIFGKWIKHGLWYPDEQIRLFQKNQAKFPLKHNHEKIQVNGSLGSLSGHLIHYNYTSVTQYIDKINHAYSDAEAQALILVKESIGMTLFACPFQIF